MKPLFSSGNFFLLFSTLTKCFPEWMGLNCHNFNVILVYTIWLLYWSITIWFFLLWIILITFPNLTTYRYFLYELTWLASLSRSIKTIVLRLWKAFFLAINCWNKIVHFIINTEKKIDFIKSLSFQTSIFILVILGFCPLYPPVSFRYLLYLVTFSVFWIVLFIWFTGLDFSSFHFASLEGVGISE